MPNRRLGRGLDGLLKAKVPGPAADLAEPVGPTATVAVSLVDPNPHQPRQDVDEAELEHLAASIREHGILQPLVVRPRGDRYEVVAGERLELALVENLQRLDLDPIEKARSFKAYLSSTGRTQSEAAGRLGLDRSTVANMIRLLDLPEPVQMMVRERLLAMGHARAILAVQDPKQQVRLAERAAREGLSVRQVEALASAGGPKPWHRRRAPAKSPEVRDLEARLREALGTKVTVEPGRKPHTGRIVIAFYNQDDLDRILERMV